MPRSRAMILAARPDRAAGHQLDHGGAGEFPRRRRRRKMLTHAAADARQHFGQRGEPPCLARLSHLFPFRMVAILQPPGGVPPGGLQVRGRIACVSDVFVGRRHRQPRQPRDRVAVADDRAVGSQIAPPLAAAPPPDGETPSTGGTQAMRLRHCRPRTGGAKVDCRSHCGSFVRGQMSSNHTLAFRGHRDGNSGGGRLVPFGNAPRPRMLSGR